MYYKKLKKFADRIKFIQKHDLKENNYSQVDLICGDPFQTYIETSTLDKKDRKSWLMELKMKRLRR